MIQTPIDLVPIACRPEVEEETQRQVLVAQRAAERRQREKEAGVEATWRIHGLRMEGQRGHGTAGELGDRSFANLFFGEVWECTTFFR